MYKKPEAVNTIYSVNTRALWLLIISNRVLHDSLIRFYSDNESDKIVNTECNCFNLVLLTRDEMEHFKIEDLTHKKLFEMYNYINKVK